MSLEKAIKQTKFINNRQKAHLNILFTANWLIDKIREALKPFNITHQQYNVLRILKGRYPDSCAACDIKEVMIDKGPDLTRLIDRLTIKGFVNRSECETNRRKLDIIITKDGLSLLKKIEPVLNDQLIDQAKITNQEAGELTRILDKMRE